MVQSILCLLIQSAGKNYGSKITDYCHFTFINIMITSLIVEGGMYAADRLFDIIPGEIGKEAVLDNIMKSFLGAAASAGLSLIPLYFGLRKSQRQLRLSQRLF